MGVIVGEGAMVERVEAGSPVANDGLRVGDIIIAIDGQPINANTSLLNLMLRFRVGQTVELDIVREGLFETLQVTLGEVPDKV